MRKPKVGIIMGSKSDAPIMEKASDILKEFGVSFDVTVASAHRNPRKVASYAERAEKNYDLIIAGAGLAAHLPGFIASHTILPVIGVPIYSKGLSGFDSLYSIVQMPGGVPVASVGIDNAKNAGILALEILSLKYPGLKEKLKNFRRKLC